MKIGIIGYGKMGKEIESICNSRGHDVIVKIDLHNSSAFESAEFKNLDAAIEFSNPTAAYENVYKCLNAGIAVVSGTTGWTESLEKARKLCNSMNGALFHSSNFSIGVYIFSHISQKLAEMMNHQDKYLVNMIEKHHIHKLDAPSGTAISLATGLIEKMDRINSWKEGKGAEQDILLIEPVRKGEINGIHEIIYGSDVDAISIKHEAFSRKGFAQGAVVAAEWLFGKTGYFGMNDMLGN